MMTSEPVWISVELARAIQQHQLTKHEGPHRSASKPASTPEGSRPPRTRLARNQPSAVLV